MNTEKNFENQENKNRTGEQQNVFEDRQKRDKNGGESQDERRHEGDKKHHKK